MESPSSPVEERLSIGTTLDGRYRIDGLVGIGGMGSVYRCEHVGIGRPVAIKVLHADFIGNREASTRFQREAIASGRLDHPNIVGVTDFGILDDGGCYLVMELLEGESLGDRLDRERIPWREAIDILRGVLRGLRHAHDRGVVHRDIKPDNVFLAVKDGDPITKILDFGIAKLFAGSADDPAATRVGITVGTPAYLSPEQAVGGEITPASDLYSTTVLLFEMLTGRPPFEDKDPLAMLGAHVGRPPPSLSEAAPELSFPPELEEIVQRGLAKAAASRFTTAKEYLTALAPLLPTSGRVGTKSGSVSALFDNDSTVVMTSQAALGALPGAPALPGSAAGGSGRFGAALEEPIPQSWITGGGAILGGLAMIALVVMLAGGEPKPAVAKLDARAQALIGEGERLRAIRIHDALALLDSSKECLELKAALKELKELDGKLPLDAAYVGTELEQAHRRLKAEKVSCQGLELPEMIKKMEAARGGEGKGGEDKGGEGKGGEGKGGEGKGGEEKKPASGGGGAGTTGTGSAAGSTTTRRN